MYTSKTFRATILVPGLVIVLLVGCASPPVPGTPAPRHPLPPGHWGGPRVEMLVSASGAQLDFGCDTASIYEPLLLDAAGHFTAAGIWTRPQPGPRFAPFITTPPAKDMFAAHFSGQSDGRTLTTTMIIEGAGLPPIHPFTATLGQLFSLSRCG